MSTATAAERKAAALIAWGKAYERGATAAERKAAALIAWEQAPRIDGLTTVKLPFDL